MTEKGVLKQALSFWRMSLRGQSFLVVFAEQADLGKKNTVEAKRFGENKRCLSIWCGRKEVRAKRESQGARGEEGKK